MQPSRQPSGGAPRRSLMNPFVPQSSPYQSTQQSQPTPSFLQYPMPTELPVRSYNPPQAQPQQQQMPGRYWQPPEPTSSYGKQSRRHGGSLDLGEFGDILDTNPTRGGDEGAAGAPSEASEMSMGSFDVSSFHDGMSGSSVGDTGGFRPEAATTGVVAMIQSGPPAAEAGLEQKKATKTIAIPSDETTRHLVDAAYTRFSDSRDEPNLKVKKLAKDENQRCQFQGCPNRARVVQSYGSFCNRHVIVAPCGFPGCRDKAMDRAAMCVKHMELGKGALQEILDARSQSVPVCRTPGCFKNDQGRGYCRGHEKMLMATGRLPAHISKRRLNSAYTMCSYPECTKHSQRHHLCRTHGNLIMKQARELAGRPGATESFDEILSRMQKDIRRCTHENCTKNSQRDRLCTMHYYEKHNLQKDGSTPVDAASASNATQPNEQIGSSHLGIGTGEGSTAVVEQTRCGKPGCGNLSYAAGLCVEHTKENQDFIHSQGHYGDSFSSGGISAIVTADIENDGRSGLFILRGKHQQSALVSGSSATTTSMNTFTTTCSNPMCDRESYGRDYCEACQKLFSPLVVSIGEVSSASQGYGFNLSNAPVSQPEEKVLLCRVGSCGQTSVTAGLCASHFRAFEMGSLSVDQVKLDSHAHQRQQELAEVAAAAAVAAEAKQGSPSSGKTRKYYCKVEGCGKQAQKHNLCKRHFRQQDSPLAGKSQPEIRPSGLPSDYVPGVQPTGFSQPSIACRFPGCSQFTSSGALLCLIHSKATFCWQPGCENLVDHQQFCEFHAFRRQCAYEGCLYTAQPNRSGCVHHEVARRCCHEYCDKFAVGSDSDWCRLHQISCEDSPCALCRLHALSRDNHTAVEDENTNRSQYNANVRASETREMAGGGFSGNNPFGRNARLM